MKSILFYITSYPNLAGTEKVTTYVANYLQEKGFKISILSFHNKANGTLNELNPQISVYFVPNHITILSKENESFIYSFFSQHNFDWIIYQDSYSSIHKLLFKTGFPVLEKLIVVEHTSPCCHLNAYQNYWNKLKWNNLHDLIRKLAYPYKWIKTYFYLSRRHSLLLKSCYKYILLSDHFRKDIYYLSGKKYSKKLAAIPNPITLPNIENKILNKRKKQIVFIGRLVESKGLDYLLQIWIEFEKSKDDWQLLIIGDGVLREQIKVQISQNGLKRVKMLGAQSYVASYLEESSILLMTSIFEGWGLVLTEAMSRGCIPFAFNSFASLSDIIDNKINGIIIPPFQVTEYTKQLINLTNHPQTLKDMAQQAIQKAKKFDIEEVGKKWIKLLK